MQNTVGSNVETLYQLIENKVEALEFVIQNHSPIIGIPLQELTLKRNLLIGGINRRGKIIIPNGQTTIEVGDSVVVITSQKGLNDINDIFQE